MEGADIYYSSPHCLAFKKTIGIDTDHYIKSHVSYQTVQNSILEDRVPKNSQAGTFGSQAALKHPKESQAGIHKKPSKDKCPGYIETPRFYSISPKN